MSIDLVWLAREGALVSGEVGTLRWSWGERKVGSISYAVRPSGAGLVLVLSYTLTQGGKEVEEPVPLEQTRLHRGGLRWWGRCPLIANGIHCGRRVGKLYLPPGSRYFGCRRCHDLTYVSSQESHKDDSLCRYLARNTSFDPDFIKHILRSWGKRNRADDF